MPAAAKLVVFVHGWSVRSTETYGALPARLIREARRTPGLSLDVRHIWLSQYVSFRDEVRMEDLARAFAAALRRELGAEFDRGRRFVCITHSTGGPVAREWWDRYYLQKSRSGPCPMSHLIMLAPPNFGSALAQLGKSRLSRIRAWFAGVEPGTRVLEWLEHGSPEAWALNRRWFDGPAPRGRNPVYPFVLTGQRVDHKLYDHVNSYTGEIGSDGVVRVAAANLNATYVRLVQEAPRALAAGKRSQNATPRYEAPALRVAERLHTPRTAFAIVPGRSHSGRAMGILASVRDNARPHPTVELVLDCIRVQTPADYRDLCDRLDRHTARVQAEERVEKESRLLPDRWFIHDPGSLVIVRVSDDRGFFLDGFDMKLLAGAPPTADGLPLGFFKDRQKNQLDPGTLTYFLNHAAMHGGDEVRSGRTVLRAATTGAARLGLRIEPHQVDGHVHHLPAELTATPSNLSNFVRANQTTWIDIEMRRVVREGVYRLTRKRRPRSFHRDPEGPAIE